MLDNLFIGTLLAGVTTLAVVAAGTTGFSRPVEAPASGFAQAPLRAAAPGSSIADVRGVPATAETPMPVHQLPRVVVRGNVMREPALFADGSPAGGRPAGAGQAPPAGVAQR